MIVLFLLGQYVIAIPLVIPLLQQLDALGIFGKREAEVSQMMYRAAQLTKPLQKIYFQLNMAAAYSDVAIGTFETEVRMQGLAKLLQIDSPQLFDHLEKLSKLVEEFRNHPYTEDEARQAMRDFYKSDSAPNIKLSYVLGSRLEQSNDTQELKNAIRREIESTLSKYGGGSR
jgi:hypothetical protein